MRINNGKKKRMYRDRAIKEHQPVRMADYMDYVDLVLYVLIVIAVGKGLLWLCH